MERFALIQRAILATALCAGIPFAVAQPNSIGAQVGGFVSQAFVVSDGNDIAGDSTSGSARYREIGVNGSWLWLNMLLSGQVVSVQNPIEGSSDPVIDFAIADVQFDAKGDDTFGMRLGRPKIPFGLYGPVRDVATARPSIFLPDGVYYFSGNARELLYSRNGAQLYWNGVSDSYSLTAEINLMANANARRLVEYQIFGQDQPGHFEQDAGWAGRLQANFFESGITTSLTWVGVDAQHSRLPVNLEFSQATGSIQLAKEEWVFTSEIARRVVRANNRGGIRGAAYLEARHLMPRDWEVYLRYEEFWREIGDRSGREYAAKEGVPAYFGYAFETSLGVRKNFRNGVSLLAEAHYVDGAGTIDRLSNLSAFFPPPGDPDSIASSWSYAAVQLAYTF